MSEPETEVYHQEASNIAVKFICGISALFGLFMLIGFVDSLSNIDGDALFLLVVGGAFITFSILLWRFTSKPGFVLTGREIEVRHFFGTRTTRYDDIVGLGTFSHTFRPRKSGGGKMNHTVTTHHLVMTLRNGKERKHTLPSFRDNQKLLEALAAKTGHTIESLPDKVEKGLEKPSGSDG